MDEYNRGDRKAGFTFTVGRQVYQVITNGQGIPWIVAEPERRAGLPVLENVTLEEMTK